MQNQCYLNVRSKCILNALRIRKGLIACFTELDGLSLLNWIVSFLGLHNLDCLS